MQSKLAGRLGALLIVLGAALAITVAIAASWADFEGLSYFATGAGYDRFEGMACPSVMSLAEEGTVRAVFDNPTNNNIRPNYRVEISGTSASRKLEGSVAVSPHSQQAVSWAVSKQDVDLGNLVLVRLVVLPVSTYATREATCGILTLDTGSIPGRRALEGVIAGSVLLTLAGLVLPMLMLTGHARRTYEAAASSPRRRALQALGISSAGAVLPALGGAWLAAWILCAVSLILLLIVLRDAFS